MATPTSPETGSPSSGDVLLFFRPELQHPPMDPQSTVTFSFMTGKGEMEPYEFVAGPNKVSAASWERIKTVPYCQNLLDLEALRVMEQEEAVQVLQDPSGAADDTNIDITKLKMAEAIKVAETSFDLEVLRKWEADERRIPVKNALNRRITQITGGDA